MIPVLKMESESNFILKDLARILTLPAIAKSWVLKHRF
jgi:hypothetical protein